MKRIITLLVSAALIASGFSIVPAAAQEAPEAPVIPAEPNVVDPARDANFGALPVTFTGADILAAWFTHDETTISAHVQTTSDARAESVLIDVGFDPGVGTACMFIDGVTEGAANDARVELYYEDDCGDQGAVAVEEGTFTIAEGPEGTSINTITVPRSVDPAFADGKTLATPFVTTWNNAADAAAVGRYDTTDPGTDYAIASPDDGKPGKSDPPGKKKGCTKGKGKKRGCEGKGKKAPKPGKPVAGCAPYTPGEMGAEAETTIVTDENTEEEPFEMEVPLGPATGTYGGDRTTRMKHNVQVDTKDNDAGLFIRLETPAFEDPDLYAYWPSGSQAAMAAGFNPLLAGGPLPSQVPLSGGLNGTGSGGHSEFTAEQIDGLRTADCQGWTLDLVNWAGRGGTYKLKVWLGDVVNEPAEEK